MRTMTTTSLPKRQAKGLRHGWNTQVMFYRDGVFTSGPVLSVLSSLLVFSLHVKSVSMACLFFFFFVCFWEWEMGMTVACQLWFIFYFSFLFFPFFFFLLSFLHIPLTGFRCSLFSALYSLFLLFVSLMRGFYRVRNSILFFFFFLQVMLVFFFRFSSALRLKTNVVYSMLVCLFYLEYRSER